MKTKPRVTGIGGIFFKAKNPKKVQAWYAKHLKLPIDPQWGGCAFEWRELRAPKKKGATAWSAFDAKTDYFRPSTKPFMINYRVANLKRVLADLKKEGVRVDPKIQESEFGKFGWVMDCEGNRIELWEPPKG
ncbi:MAG TPA: VOC family protein [Opitutaceae bacterium]|nr:VOC family protein [Opitutaceae bacterium]